jgi:phage shock protein E
MSHAGLRCLAISTVIFMVVPACSQEPAPRPAEQGKAAAGLPDRDPALAHKLVSEGGVLLDVRTPDEFAGRHIDGAVNIPVGELSGRLGEIEKLTGGDKQKPIVVYCQTGGRASRAKGVLTSAGYTQVTNLGGVDDWDKK